MAEPVTLAEAKAQCHMVEDDSEDAYLSTLLTPSRAYVERKSGCLFVGSTRTTTFGRWGDCLEIARRPIASVTSVAYLDESGSAATYGGLVSIGAYSTRIYPAVGESFPGLAAGGLITVTYVGGAFASDTEEYLIGKRAMLILIGHWFEYREAAAAGRMTPEIEFTIRELLDTIRPLPAY